MQPGTSGVSPCIDRRALLTGIGTCALTVVGGCTTGDADARAVETPVGVSSAPRRRVLASADAVPLRGGKRVAGVLIVQPTPGQFKAFDARCPHRGALVSAPEAGVITCFEHNSTFRDVDGAVLRGPALRGLTEIPIIVNNATIVMLQ